MCITEFSQLCHSLRQPMFIQVFSTPIRVAEDSVRSLLLNCLSQLSKGLIDTLERCLNAAIAPFVLNHKESHSFFRSCEWPLRCEHKAKITDRLCLLAEKTFIMPAAQWPPETNHDCPTIGLSIHLIDQAFCDQILFAQTSRPENEN